MRRSFMVFAAMVAMMVALAAPAFAQGQGSGGHHDFSQGGTTFTGGSGGSANGSGGGEHVSGDFAGLPVNGGQGSGGSTVSGHGGDGSGGCFNGHCGSGLPV